MTLKVAHTFRKIVLTARPGNFLFHASIQTEGAHALRHLRLREACPAPLCWGDLIRFWVGLTGLQATKTSKAVPAASAVQLEPADIPAAAQPSASDHQSKAEEHQWNMKGSFGITLQSDLVEAT